MKKKLTQSQISRIQWAKAAGFDFAEFEKVLSKTERKFQTKASNQKGWIRLCRIRKSLKQN